jgi:hypothetical protein
MLGRDMSPVVFPALVRLWSSVGLGASDFELRLLGFLVGLGLIGALWCAARIMGCGYPVVSLGLLAANPTLLGWGDSLRAYGLGCLFIVLTLASVWRLLLSPCRSRFILAAVFAVLSVQTLYQNAFLVLALCVAGFAVCTQRRQWRAARWVACVGVVAAVSLLPYAPLVVESQEWWILQKPGFQWHEVSDCLRNALSPTARWSVWLWVLLPPLAIAGGILAQRHRGEMGSADSKALSLFGVSALLAGVGSFTIFFLLAGLGPVPWYFLPIMVFASIAMDAALAGWNRRFGIWPVLVALLAVAALFPSAFVLSKYRQTNIDLVTAELQRLAKPGDYIVVPRWQNGITFERYFKGDIEWATLPPIGDHRFHRYDLLRKAYCSPSPEKPVLEQAERTLASGHVLWIVGRLPVPSPPGQGEPPELQPAPRADMSWFQVDVVYSLAWRRQMSCLLAYSAENVRTIRISSPYPVNSYEEAPLVMATGWRPRKL